jgi:hypothetical protein
MAIWTLVSSVIVGLQCRPLSLAWGVGEGTCLHPSILGNVGYSISAMDIVSSFLYAVRGPQIPRQRENLMLISLLTGIADFPSAGCSAKP